MVSVRLEYVPAAKLAVLRIVAKSMSLAKSTVIGFPDARTETGVPPPWGVRLAAVIVTVKDSTSQTGASFPKITTEPRLGGELLELDEDELDTEGVEDEGCCIREEFPPQTIMRDATIRRTAANKYACSLGRTVGLLPA